MIKLREISTFDGSGEPNGFVVPIWNVFESEWRPDQVYLTVVYPGQVKGPHLHKKRFGRFVCIKGDARIVTRDESGKYAEHLIGEHYQMAMVEVPTGVAAAIYNAGDDDAYLLNMPTPAWRADDQDEWPVENWTFEQSRAHKANV